MSNETLQLNLVRGLTTLSVDTRWPLDEEVTVQFVVSSATASSGLDFILDDGTITFGVGESSLSISVTVSVGLSLAITDNANQTSSVVLSHILHYLDST